MNENSLIEIYDKLDIQQHHFISIPSSFFRLAKLDPNVASKMVGDQVVRILTKWRKYELGRRQADRRKWQMITTAISDRDGIDEVNLILREDQLSELLQAARSFSSYDDKTGLTAVLHSLSLSPTDRRLKVR